MTKRNKTVELIPVTSEWLETLLALSEECKKAQDKWFESENPLMPTCFSKLIGYSSSAETYLLLNRRPAEEE